MSCLAGMYCLQRPVQVPWGGAGCLEWLLSLIPLFPAIKCSWSARRDSNSSTDMKTGGSIVCSKRVLATKSRQSIKQNGTTSIQKLEWPVSQCQTILYIYKEKILVIKGDLKLNTKWIFLPSFYQCSTAFKHVLNYIEFSMSRNLVKLGDNRLNKVVLWLTHVCTLKHLQTASNVFHTHIHTHTHTHTTPPNTHLHSTHTIAPCLLILLLPFPSVQIVSLNFFLKTILQTWTWVKFILIVSVGDLLRVFLLSKSVVLVCILLGILRVPSCFPHGSVVVHTFLVVLSPL